MKQIGVWVLEAVLIGSCSLASQAETTNKGNTLASPNGRYVLGQISEMRQDQYMLDTRTGKLWLLGTENQSMVLFPVVYHQGKDMYSLLPDGEDTVHLSPNVPDKSSQTQK